MKILCAEDDKDIRRHIVNALEDLGHLVTAVKSGDDLVQRLFDNEEKFDLLVTDNRMPPGPRGLEILEVMRRSPKFAQMPVIVLTSDDDLADHVTKLGGIYEIKGNIYENIESALARIPQK